MIRKLVVSNYRSIGEAVAIPLGRLTALVGLNAAGKSSIIDVLRLVGEALRDGLPNALARRNGFHALRRRGAGDSAKITVRVELELAEGSGAWEFSLAGEGQGDYRIGHERVEWEPNVDVVMKMASTMVDENHPLEEAKLWQRIREALAQNDTKEVLHYLQLGSRVLQIEDGEVQTTDPLTAILLSQKVSAPAGHLWMPYIPVITHQLFVRELIGIGCYTISPNTLRPPQKPDAVRRPMDEHGSNWAAALERLRRDTEGRDLVAALYRIVGDITDYRVTRVGGYLAVEFRHGEDTWLDTTQESDGTLRVAGLLTALLQTPPPSLYAIEEPELTVHPGVLPVLLDFMTQAARRSQVLISTHSPELMDLLDIDQIVVVERHAAATTAAPVDGTQRSLVKDQLLATSDLLRAEGLHQAQPAAVDEAEEPHAP